MDITLLSQIITLLVFGVLGYFLGKRLQVPAKIWTWILWLITLVLAGSVKMRIVDIFGFVIASQDVLQGLVAGILINFVVRASRSETPQASTSGTTKS
jgi:hypothetical protein